MSNTFHVISHNSACHYWYRTAKTIKYAELPKAGNATVLPRHYEDTQFGSSPYHVLLFNRNCRHSTKHAVIHFSSSLFPAGSFVRIAPSLFVASPELTFLQMANHLTKPELIELGSILCSSYYLQDDNSIARRPKPLTTKEQINSYLKKAKKLRGIPQARKCANRILENAYSPMEIKLGLLLSLPKYMGGYGFGEMQLNSRISPGRKSLLTNQSFYLGDLCWVKSKILVEYDGANYHQDMTHDKRRTNALESLGWKVLFVTKAELSNIDELHLLARQLAYSLNNKAKNPPNWNQKNLELRNSLRISTYDACGNWL